MDRRLMGRLFICISAFAVLTAQTPAPAGTPALPDKPLRHLEYAFSVDYQRNGEVHEGAIGTARSGVGSLMSGIGRQGTLDVDVMAAANDGGLVIRAAEWLQEQPRARQSFICAAYPEGRVICPEYLGVTDVENQIMGYLGRGFFDPSLVDDKGRWQRKFSDKYVSVVSNFTIQGSVQANPLTVLQETSITSLSGNYTSWTESARFTYDPALEVLDTLHDVAIQQARGAATVQTTMDFRLTKDSFAKS
ncbi:MAG TPA: hypothetical protein VIJ77_07505 [Candidatus Tumulicola sp.]